MALGTTPTSRQFTISQIDKPLDMVDALPPLKLNGLSKSSPRLYSEIAVHGDPTSERCEDGGKMTRTDNDIHESSATNEMVEQNETVKGDCNGVSEEDFNEGRVDEDVPAFGSANQLSLQNLLSRVEANERALSSLSSIVSSLQSAVQALQQPTSTPTPPTLITTNSSDSTATTDSTLSITSLAHQLSALSSSVTQLQRLQSSSLIRRNSEKSFASSPVIGNMELKNTNGKATASTEKGQSQSEMSSTVGGGGGGGTSLNLSTLPEQHEQDSKPQHSPKWQSTQPSSIRPISQSATSNQNTNLFSQQNLQRQPTNISLPPGSSSGSASRLHSPVPRPSTSVTSSGVPSLSNTPMPSQLQAGGTSFVPSSLPSRPTLPRQTSAVASSYGGGGNTSTMGPTSNQHALGNLGMRSAGTQGRPSMGRSASSSLIMPNIGGMGGDNSLRGSLSNNEGWQTQMRLPMKSPSVAGGPRGMGERNIGNDGQPGTPGLVIPKWENLPLSQDLLRAIAKYGIGPPNKIQARALPFMLKGSDIIAQAPPTQERIIAYVIPIIQLCLSLEMSTGQYKGPKAVVITTTVDQANQAHKLVRDLGSSLGIRSSLITGPAGADISNDVRYLTQNSVQVVVGTPARVHDIFAGQFGAGVPAGEVRLLILDEVDQLIARNLYEHVANVVKLFPPSKSRGNNQGGGVGVIGSPAITSPAGVGAVGSPYDPGMQSPFNPASQMPFPTPSHKFQSGPPTTSTSPVNGIERQTCIFSNTIPTDVVNFSQSIMAREPVRVLVRREGSVNTSQEGPHSGNLRHYYLYLALAGTAGRVEQPVTGPGTIGSGRGKATGAAKSEAYQAREYKLEALASMLDDYPLWQAIVYVGSQATLEAVVAKLNSRQFETVAVTADMPVSARNQALATWRASARSGHGPRFLIVFDLIIKPPEVLPTSLVVNFDLPRSVEAYAQRAASAIQSSNHRSGSMTAPSVVLNFIQAAGGDVEMLRSTECAYRFKCSEVPASLLDLF